MDLFDGRFPKPYCEGFAWVWLEAHVDEKGRIETSYRKLGEAWGWNQVKVMRTLEKWRSVRLIVTAKIQTGTQIKLRERGGFNQASVTPDVTASEDLFAGSEAAPVAKTKARKASRLDPSWRLTKRLGEWACGRGHSPEWVRAEAERFRLYWISATGQKAMKRDWDATWSQWVLNAERRETKGAGVGDGMLDAMAAKYERR